MSPLSAHFRHLDRMEAAISACRRHLIESGGLEPDHNTVTRLTAAIVREIEGLTETITSERMPDCHDAILDEVAHCFKKAIKSRDERREEKWSLQNA